MAWIERTDRREKKAKHFYDPETGKFRAEFTIHDRHYDNNGRWEDVDEDITDDGGGFDKQCDKTRHKIRFAGNGRRRWYPRRDVDEYVEITGIEYWTDQGGGRWRNLTLPAAVWKKQGATWERNDLRIEVINTWKRVKETFTLLNSDAPTRLRFGLELSGLVYDHESGELTSTTDGLVWGSIDPPTAQDANEAAVPVTASYDGTYIEWSADVTGATFPVTIDPTFTDGYGGDVATSKDTCLLSAQPTFNYGVRDGVREQPGLLQYDLSSIDSEATCDSATLYLYKGYATSTATTYIYSVASGNNGWIEGTKNATLAGAGEPCWNAKEANGSGGVTTAWAGSAGMATSGTDYEASSIGSFEQTNAQADNYEYNPSLNSTRVEAWFGATNTNYGLLLYNSAGHWVSSSENVTTGYRPKLVVAYTTDAAGNPYYAYAQQ